MRPAVFVASSLAAVVACSEPNTDIRLVQVSWMEWPAEVLAATPFDVRLIGYGGGCGTFPTLVTTPRVDESAVTFEPYVVGEPGPGVCRQAELIIRMLVPFDTNTRVSGLETSFPRTFEIRGATAPARVQTFGEVIARPSGELGGRVHAGGFGYLSTDPTGCTRLSTLGLSSPYVVENPGGPTGGETFVRGYLYDAATPVCGETRVFHLLSVH